MLKNHLCALKTFLSGIIFVSNYLYAKKKDFLNLEN